VGALVRRLRRKECRPSSETENLRTPEWKGRAKSAGQDTGTNRFAQSLGINRGELLREEKIFSSGEVRDDERKAVQDNLCCTAQPALYANKR
jgi:hypothetical protein